MDPSETPKMILEARNLGFQYEGAESHALRGVNLSVERGEFVLLAGPSGCGKTTLCRCLNGLIPHFYPGVQEGEILVDGSNVTSMPTSEVSRKVGYVFQNPENQLFALRVDWAMGITGTTELKNLAPYELSGGQQQRVALAGILAMKPAVVVMDEPTSFLDPVTAEGVMKAVADLRLEHGITVIVVEHRLDLVSRYADRIIVMDSGTVVADGSVQDVLDGQFDQLTGLGVGVPRVSQLWAMLKRDGLVSGQTPKTVEAAAEKLGGKLSA